MIAASENHFSGIRNITILQFDDQLNMTYGGYYEAVDLPGDDQIMIQDIENDGALITYINEGNRLLITFMDKLGQGATKSFISFSCSLNPTIVSLDYDYKNK